ncbi:alcohol dehydrogenase catalytic domain-containing protein [Georgenia sp. Z1344]|uniref:alcohol dehydrogenase catalytic domain-containing protein n=1 Tax=Georgenia sp. Z1344 TaxID=3416706 RepID=UPI003CF81864
MKALIYDGPGKIEWCEHPKPQIQDATDLVLKVTATTVCGSDSHIIKGGFPETPAGLVLGHEGVGIVEEVGSAVTAVKPGDRVLATCVTACATCPACREGLVGQCRTSGGWALGHLIDGLQAEYARIPFANTSVYKIPDELTDEQVLFLTDILATGYEVGVLRGNVQPGDTVVIVGSGPVGLSTLITAKLFSPSNIVVVDPVESRRAKALEMGASHVASPEEAKSVVDELTDGLGADVTIEAAGFPAPFELAVDLVRPGGRIANIGGHETPVSLPMETLWSKIVTLTTGIPNGLSVPALMRAIEAGTLDATPLITHRMKLDEMEKGYDVFLNAAEHDSLKVVLTP